MNVWLTWPHSSTSTSLCQCHSPKSVSTPYWRNQLGYDQCKPTDHLDDAAHTSTDKSVCIKARSLSAGRTDKGGVR